MRIDTSTYPEPVNLGPFSVAFSTKTDGNMWREQSTREETQRNRQAFFTRIGHDESLQIYRVRTGHSANVEFITKRPTGLLRDVELGHYSIETDFDFYKQAADGILTRDSKSGVLLIAGDCTPVIVWDQSTLLHGILHIGLLGALNGTIQTLKPLLSRHGIKPYQLNAYLGPSIAGANYDVTKSGLWVAIENQVRANKTLKTAVDKHFDGIHFDVRGSTIDDLLEVGVKESNIQVFSKCTTDSDSQFFSHYSAMRAGHNPESFASVIWVP
jgi:copper oxidase (laccase) domain-containing protein